MDTFAAVYALAARGWPVAQRIVVAEVERTQEKKEPPSKAELLKWYFDLQRQLRKSSQ
jgi:hypothetical protein